MKSVKLSTGILFSLSLLSMISCSKPCEKIELADGSSIQMVNVPEEGFTIGQTEIPQNFYQAVMGENPSSNKGELLPAEKVSYYDAIVFCNKLSIMLNKTPAYTVNGSVNPQDWNYTPHQNCLLEGKIVLNNNADGYRLPTYEEWAKAYNFKKEYEWSGSDDYEKVAWLDANSGKKSHEIKTLAPNELGIYDMAGNVYEWLWTAKDDNNKLYCGGCFFEGADMATVNMKRYNYGSMQLRTVGFRIAYSNIE